MELIYPVVGALSDGAVRRKRKSPFRPLNSQTLDNTYDLVRDLPPSRRGLVIYLRSVVYPGVVSRFYTPAWGRSPGFSFRYYVLPDGRYAYKVGPGRIYRVRQSANFKRFLTHLVSDCIECQGALI